MKRLDFAIIAAALLMSGALYLVGRVLPGGASAMAEIYADGRLVENLPLAEPVTKTIHTGYGENTIQIDSGGIGIVSADCPGKDCVHSPSVSKPGQVIACLPNRLLIRIAGADNQGEVDIVAG